MKTQVAPVSLARASEASVVAFPNGKRPEQSPIYTHNQLWISALPEHIWPYLVQASRWPEFYGNAKDIELEGGESELRRGTRFHWTTFGVRVHTVVEELEPNRRLAWSGRGLGSTAYHGWVLVPKDGGTLVITEETQQGIVASIARWFLCRGLLTWHQRWLEGLARVSEADGGAPNRS